MQFKTLKEKLAEGLEVRVMAISAFPNPKIIEVAGKFGDLDGVWIDQEHSGLPNQELELLLLACRASGLDAFVRVAPTDYATVMRPMEGGASGIMMAQVRSVADVEQAVRWMKYSPEGERGMFKHTPFTFWTILHPPYRLLHISNTSNLSHHNSTCSALHWSHYSCVIGRRDTYKSI